MLLGVTWGCINATLDAVGTEITASCLMSNGSRTTVSYDLSKSKLSHMI
jgi:hypothetical protein